MSNALRMKPGNNRSRGISGLQRPAQLPLSIGIVSASVSGSVLTMEFDQTVNCRQVPAYTTDVAGATAVSFTQPSPTTIAITFSASISAATLVNIPSGEPAVRNSLGGFVSPSTFPVGA